MPLSAWLLIFLGIPLGIGSSVYAGFVIVKLWTWFMIPLGLPAITLFHAIGLDVLLMAFKGMGNPKVDDDETDSDKKIRNAWATCAGGYIFFSALLLYGYIAHIFM